MNSSGTPDDRSNLAKAMNLASQITTISLMAIAPAAGGYYLDQYAGTIPLFLIVGTLLGMAISGWQLVKLVGQIQQDDSTSG